MKKSILLLPSSFVFLLIAFAFKPIINQGLEIGSPIPKSDHKMMDISGKQVSLDEINGVNGLLVIFACNACPYVKLSEGRIKEMARLSKTNKIGVVIINSNEAQRDADDSYDAIKKYAQYT